MTPVTIITYQHAQTLYTCVFAGTLNAMQVQQIISVQVEQNLLPREALATSIFTHTKVLDFETMMASFSVVSNQKRLH